MLKRLHKNYDTGHIMESTGRQASPETDPRRF
jgi:hypothetical protein